MSRTRTLQVLFALTIMALLLVSVSAYRSLERTHREHQAIRSGHLSLRLMEMVLSSIKECEASLREFRRTHDRASLSPLVPGRRELSMGLEMVSTLATDKNRRARTDSLAALVDSAFMRIDRFPLGAIARKDTAVDRKVDEVLDLLRSTRSVHGGAVLAEETELKRSRMEEERIGLATPILLLAFVLLALLALALLFVRALLAMGKATRAEQEVKRKVVELDEEVSTRKFAQRSLKHVLDSSVSGIMAFRSVRDAGGAIVDFEWIMLNHQAEVMLAKQADQLMGARMLSVLPATMGSGLFDRFVDVVNSGNALRLDSVYDINGLGLYLDVHVVKLSDGVVVTYTDVSEREQHRAVLQESERLALTGKIARTIAHEVRNPLTNVLLALDQIKEGTAGDAELAPFTDIVQRNVDRVAHLITEMLESSKPREAARRPCQIGTVLSDAVDLIQDRIELQHMELFVEIPPDMPLVEVDREEMKLALSNIGINAIEAMEEGRGRLRISAVLQRGAVKVMIEDNGKGMTEEEMAHLFDPFYTGRPGGMGLGLTTARSILNSHGVHIEVSSKVGGGTRFTLLFPSRKEG